MFTKLAATIVAAAAVVGLVLWATSVLRPGHPGVAQTTQAAKLVGAGDIAGNYAADSATADIVAGMPEAQVFTAGDNAYPNGTAAEFDNYYDPTWGRFKARTWPTPGNHEYNTSGASGYSGYFGALATPDGKSYYKKTLNGWSVYMLDSEIDPFPDGEQYKWLKSQLQAEPNSGCAMAVYHRPVISSGQYGNLTRMNQVFSLLDAEGAELVVNGHEHDYERFGKTRIVSGEPQPSADGVVEVIVGTGGTGLRPFGTVKQGSQARNNTAHGVLELTLDPSGYSGRFVPVAGETWTDSFSGGCGS